MTAVRRRLPGTGLQRAAALIAVVVVGVSVAFAARFGSDPQAVSSPLLGRPVPALVLPVLDQARTVALRAPGQVTVVNFWASWCIPCREEHAALTRAAAAYRNDGVRVVGVVYQDQDDGVRAFLAEFGGGYDVLKDPNSTAAIDFGIFGIPETFFVDRRGAVVAKVAGPVNDNVLIDTISRILRGETPTSAPPGTVQPGRS